MHGSGNDFVVIDNREREIRASQAPGVARMLCRRKFGVGADGLILVEEAPGVDFKWRFYNADGSEAEMCGNGGRRVARFAYEAGIAPEQMDFLTLAGVIQASVKGRRVKLQLPSPRDLRLDLELSLHAQRLIVHGINTGVPHAVVFVQDIDDVPVYEWGRLIRHHEAFGPPGTNVDFVQVEGPDRVVIRTYERGVEDETMAFGTGAVASAIVAGIKEGVSSPVTVRTWGGEELRVYFGPLSRDLVEEVFLEGETVVAYSGVLDGDLQVAHGEEAATQEF